MRVRMLMWMPVSVCKLLSSNGWRGLRNRLNLALHLRRHILRRVNLVLNTFPVSSNSLASNLVLPLRICLRALVAAGIPKNRLIGSLQQFLHTFLR